MATLIETLIYLLSILGLIFTSISFIEIYNYRNSTDYNLFNKKNKKISRIQVTISMENVCEKEENKIIDTLLRGEYTNLQEVVDCVTIEKKN